MLKVVLDTNVLISAFLWDGNKAELFRKIEKNKVKFYTSFEIISEMENVIRREKFNELLMKVKLIWRSLKVLPKNQILKNCQMRIRW